MFPASDVGQHVILQTGHLAEFALVMWWDRLAGATKLPYKLETNNRLSDALQQFAKRRDGLDGATFRGEDYVSRKLWLLSLSMEEPTQIVERDTGISERKRQFIGGVMSNIPSLKDRQTIVTAHPSCPHEGISETCLL